MDTVHQGSGIGDQGSGGIRDQGFPKPRARGREPYRATRAGSRLAACWLRRRLHVFSLQAPFASRPEICFTLSPAKTLAHSHRQPRSPIPDREPLDPLSLSCPASLIRNIRRFPFRRTTAHRKPNPPRISGPAGWLVSFRRAQRRELYSRRLSRSS